MASFIWDIERILSVELLERGAIINSEQYLQTLSSSDNKFEGFD